MNKKIEVGDKFTFLHIKCVLPNEIKVYHVYNASIYKRKIVESFGEMLKVCGTHIITYIYDKTGIELSRDIKYNDNEYFKEEWIVSSIEDDIKQDVHIEIKEDGIKQDAHIEVKTPKVKILKLMGYSMDGLRDQIVDAFNGVYDNIVDLNTNDVSLKLNINELGALINTLCNTFDDECPTHNLMDACYIKRFDK